MNIYAESSAVLAWLLGEEDGHRVREVLRRAELVTTSDLALIECDRVLIRAVTLGEISEAAAADRQAHLNEAAAHWHLWRLTLDIVDEQGVRFPRNRCAALTRFTWLRRWPCAPLSRE